MNNQFTFADAAKGVEFSGGHNYGGYHYSVAIIDQNTSGIGPVDQWQPVCTLGHGRRQWRRGFASDSSFKDVYARFSYRFNLERDSESRDSIQAAGATGPRDHTYLNLGTFYLDGKSQQGFAGARATGTNTAALCARTLLPRRRRFQLQLPDVQCFRPVHVRPATTICCRWTRTGADSTCRWVPQAACRLDLSPACRPSSTAALWRPITWFCRGSWPIGRWDGVNSSADRINGLMLRSSTPYLRAAPFHAQPLHAGHPVPDPPQHQGFV